MPLKVGLSYLKLLLHHVSSISWLIVMITPVAIMLHRTLLRIYPDPAEVDAF